MTGVAMTGVATEALDGPKRQGVCRRAAGPDGPADRALAEVPGLARAVAQATRPGEAERLLWQAQAERGIAPAERQVLTRAEREAFAEGWLALGPEEGRGRARLLAETVLALPEALQPAARRDLVALGLSRDCPHLLDRTLSALARGQLLRAWRLAILLDDGLLDDEVPLPTDEGAERERAAREAAADRALREEAFWQSGGE